MIVPARLLAAAGAVLLGGALLGGALLALAAAPETPGIKWSKGRPLKWADFSGKIPDPAPTFAAYSMCRIHGSFNATLKSRSAGANGAMWECTAKPEKLLAWATFQPAESWVRPNAKSAPLLAHEQGHFDICEALARKAQAALDSEIGAKAFRGAGADQPSAEKAAKARIQSVLDEIVHRVTKEMEEEFQMYDADTGHGTKETQQREWLAKIAERLDPRSKAPASP